MNHFEIELDERLEDEYTSFCNHKECNACKFNRYRRCQTMFKITTLLRYIIDIIERGH